MTARTLISKLGTVKETGRHRWVAECPAHNSKSRSSLAITELDDGRVVIHDFGGCSAEEVLSAVGLTFEALYPERQLGDHVKRERRPFSATDALKCISFEATLVAIAASNIAAGMAISEEERTRLHQAAGRIRHAMEVVLG